MANSRVAGDITGITAFLLNTCRLNQLRIRNASDGILERISMHPMDDLEVDYILLLTGSAAEFYIDPILPCVGDVDLMYHRNSCLAIPAGQSPPTRLPDEFHSSVKVFEILDSPLPGYVYLKRRYTIAVSDDVGKYETVEYDAENYLSNRLYMFSSDLAMRGPAQLIGRKYNIYGYLPIDLVRCTRCLSWPLQAADWPTRHRNHDWPDSATVDRVVSNGCDVASVAHYQCKDDEWMGTHQWRVSFSRAEVLLLNSWMPVQQIVYHLLRKFTKTELLTDNLDNGGPPRPLSNYHIKSLMLWACELKPRCWWTVNIRFVRVCVELLNIFADQLIAEQCQHYFANSCNLLENLFNVKSIASRLRAVDETWLSTWLINSYIRKCLHLCPDNASRLLDNVSANSQLQGAISAVVRWRQNTELFDVCHTYAQAECYVSGHATISFQTVPSCNNLLQELSKFDERYSSYLTANALFYVSYNFSKNSEFDDKLRDLVAVLVGQQSIISSREYYSQCSSEVFLGKAAKLMKDAARKSINTDQLIKIELSKAYLYRALNCTDSYADSTYCLVNIYLAVLYYTTGQYQTAKDHCALVMRTQNHAQTSSETVQGENLLKLDRHVDSALGLTTLYQYVLTASFSQSVRNRYAIVFTPEVFVHYLNMSLHGALQSRSVKPTRVTFLQTADQLRHCVRRKQNLFIADAFLFKLTSQLSENDFRRKNAAGMRCHHSATNPTELNTSKLVELLQKSAVEHLTTYRQLVSRECMSIGLATVVTTDFEALYEYKRGNYRRCLQLSTQNVHQLLYAAGSAVIPTFLAFIQLLDDDIVSLIGLTLIMNPDCRDFNFSVPITQLTLSLYLMTQCQSKLRHSATSLSQTLEYIEVAQRKFAPYLTLEHLTLKLAKRMIVRRGITNFLGPRRS